MVSRQADPTFVALLNEMRCARLSSFSTNLLHHAVRNPPTLPVVPTKLFPHNTSAEEHNLDQLRALPGKTKQWHATDTGSMPWLLKELLVPAALVLNLNAQVTHLISLDLLPTSPTFNPSDLPPTFRDCRSCSSRISIRPIVS